MPKSSSGLPCGCLISSCEHTLPGCYLSLRVKGPSVGSPACKRRPRSGPLSQRIPSRPWPGIRSLDWVRKFISAAGFHVCSLPVVVLSAVKVLPQDGFCEQFLQGVSWFCLRGSKTGLQEKNQKPEILS